MARLRQGGRKKWSPGMREECLGGLLLSPTPRLPGGREHRLLAGRAWAAPRDMVRAPDIPGAGCSHRECVCLSPHGTISKESAWTDRSVSRTPSDLSCDGPQLRGHLSSLLDGRELVLSSGRASGSSFRLSSLRSGFMSPSYWEFLKDRGRDTSSPRPGWVGRGRETERRGLHPHSFRSKTNCPHACLQSGEPVGAC